MPRIHSIVYQPQMSELYPTTTFHRVPTKSAYLVANYGIEGDRKAGCNPNRQINIVSRESLDLLEQYGFKTQPGEMGEQMIVEGINLAALKRGDCLFLGPEAIVEVTFPRTSCKRFEEIQELLDSNIIYDLGIFVHVIQSGVVTIGDAVTVVEIEAHFAVSTV